MTMKKEYLAYSFFVFMCRIYKPPCNGWFFAFVSYMGGVFPKNEPSRLSTFLAFSCLLFVAQKVVFARFRCGGCIVNNFRIFGAFPFGNRRFFFLVCRCLRRCGGRGLGGIQRAFNQIPNSEGFNRHKILLFSKFSCIFIRKSFQFGCNN